MKSVTIILLLVFASALFYQKSEARISKPQASPNDIIWRILKVNGWDCKSLRDPKDFCKLIHIIGQYKLCLQDLINFLIEECGWDCKSALTYIVKCGCFDEFLKASGLSHDELIQLIADKFDCDLNVFFNWWLCQ